MTDLIVYATSGLYPFLGTVALISWIAILVAVVVDRIPPLVIVHHEHKHIER